MGTNKGHEAGQRKNTKEGEELKGDIKDSPMKPRKTDGSVSLLG